MKVKMLRGLPASGKTTAARKMVKEDGSAGRVNRDDLRAMLFNSEWSGKREAVVVECEKAIAAVLLKHNHTPSIDDTNLTQKHHDMWSGFAREHDATMETRCFDETLSTCIERDGQRERSVGASVITKMAAGAGLIPWGEREIIICDIDGTIADGRHREHFVQGEKKDWDGYYALLSGDEPIDIVCRWIAEEAKERTIVLVSGRPDTYQQETIAWLKKHGIHYDYLLMRGGGDRRPDTMVKAEILKVLPKDKIVFVIDDRPSVVRMWRENGLRVFPVRGACEDF